MLDGDQGEVECGCVGWVSECRARGSKGLRGRGEEKRVPPVRRVCTREREMRVCVLVCVCVGEWGRSRRESESVG